MQHNSICGDDLSVYYRWPDSLPMSGFRGHFTSCSFGNEKKKITSKPSLNLYLELDIRFQDRISVSGLSREQWG